MKEKLWIIIPFIILLFSCVSYGNEGNEVKYKNLNFDLNDIYIIQNHGLSVIEINSRNRLKLKKLLLAAIEVATNNLVNVDTNEYKNGSPYKPFIIKVDKNLNYTIEPYDKITWVYDPSHPLAKASGEKKGYVSYPYVNIEQHQDDIYKITEFLLKSDL